jgi:hypothetical protein
MWYARYANELIRTQRMVRFQLPGFAPRVDGHRATEDQLVMIIKYTLI